MSELHYSKLQGEGLREVFSFKYLGSQLNKAGTMHDELKRRIHLAKFRFSQLTRTVFKRRHVTEEVKIRLYKTVVVSTLLWDCANWSWTKKDLQSFEVFNHKSLLRILGKSYRDHLTREEIVYRTHTTKIEFQVRMRRMKAVGRIERNGDTHLPKKVLYGDIAVKPNQRRKNTKTFAGWLKEDLDMFGIASDEWRSLAQTKGTWEQLLRERQRHLNDQWTHAKKSTFKLVYPDN